MTAAPRPAPHDLGWVASLFAALGLGERASAREVFERSDRLATRLAPDTRRLWQWILFFEGLAVLVPLLWLLRPWLGLSVSWVASGAIVSTLLVIGACWWLRWRAMRQTWSRTRVLGEIARSRLATDGWPGDATRAALDASPSLQPILDRIVEAPADETPASFEARKATYLKHRIEDQRAYYAKQHAKATRTRRRISTAVTRSLDAALFLAVAGLVVGFSSSAALWIRLSGADFALGLFGAALPLAAIIYQSFGAYQELDRRAGRYRQQEEFLDAARERLVAATTEDAALDVVRSVERELLAEVTAWYYQMDGLETFYRARSAPMAASTAVGDAGGWSLHLMQGLGWSVGFVTRVLLGRGIVVALSVVVTTALIAYRFPQGAIQQNMLRVADGRLLSSARPESWDPRPERTKNGFILIAHGLHSAAVKPGPKGKHWMTVMRESLETRLGERCPDICLVDWRFAASPSRFSPDGFTATPANTEPGALDELAGWVQDVARIRPHGQEVGDTVGFKLARAIRKGRLDATRPMHLIGHSAGGFVVVRAALLLHDLDLAPPDLRVTLLDTPMPDTEDLAALLAFCPVDFIRASDLAQGVPDAGIHENYERFDLEVPEGLDAFLDAHEFAHAWYIRTIREGGPEGFGRSPFAR